MRINSLILNNFSSYEGVNQFDFSTEDGKNIILIGGQNGAGKTSMFSAIKVALYGPLAFGYVGVNSHYTKKIKEYINSKAFQRDHVEASVQISISLMVDREIEEYEITRSWEYLNQKLEEFYVVKKNGAILDEQKRSYFQNYLLGVIPPSLFDFFLFDGEEVGNIFATTSYNGYVKNALFTMCDMDVFELMRKYASTYVAKTDDGSDGAETESAYRTAQLELEKLDTNIEKHETKLVSLKEELEQVDIDLVEIETAFKQAGGIGAVEKEALHKELLENERIKQERITLLKSFVENLMPFFIVREFADKITTQLESEEKTEIFEYLMFKLQGKGVYERIGETLDKDVVDQVLNAVIETVKPGDYSEDAEPLHSLSKDETNRVYSIITALDDFNVDEMLAIVDAKENAANRTAEINRKLKSSLSVDDEKTYSNKENKLLKRKAKITTDMMELETKLSSERDERVTLQNESNRLYQQLVNSVQNAHVYELSSGLSKMMEQLLANKTVSLKRKLEEQVVNNLKQIYRKDNLITHVEIEDNYQFNLYQNATYFEMELLSLINNVGNDEAVRLVGKKGAEELYSRYGASTMSEVQKKIKAGTMMESVETYTRVDLGRLSKGERQIFILALYWAIITISGKNIPFIIDTPYARIDANHRREISEKFFPNISKQVIILSTDEEINQEYYDIIHPFVAREYLLTNDEVANKTTVENRYFFEVSK